jgi:hypothetical protein
VEDTYRLFAEWDFDLSVPENLQRGFGGSYKSVGWEREVVATVGRRLRNFDRLKSLVVLASKGMSLPDWRDCWRLWICATEQPFGRFVLEWLYDEFQAGRYNIRTEDVLDTAAAAWAGRAGSKPLSEYGLVRAARDLLKTATDLGMLSGKGPVKTFTHLTMGDDVFLFYVHQIAELEGSYARVPCSPLWRAAFMSPDDVQRVLLRLHQYRKVDYQVAGSIQQLTLPHTSALSFAESISA